MQVNLCRAGNGLSNEIEAELYQFCVYTHNGYIERGYITDRQYIKNYSSHTSDGITLLAFVNDSTGMVLPARADYLYTPEEWYQGV